MRRTRIVYERNQEDDNSLAYVWTWGRGVGSDIVCAGSVLADSDSECVREPDTYTDFWEGGGSRMSSCDWRRYHTPGGGCLSPEAQCDVATRHVRSTLAHTIPKSLPSFLPSFREYSRRRNRNHHQRRRRTYTTTKTTLLY
ncbi:hypothetical protein KQX54_017229 [Cotesia glomerata]|uniref:Uncharacterized protein n=1 Tax=Cotesia glomerata TaxID=32391 RepID=A0AAV7HZU0_COTGL|nr:hypothetical protein KQX54_017229 [Cotesia glomerata]